MAYKVVLILDAAPWPKAVTQLIDEYVTKLVYIAIQDRLLQGLNGLVDRHLIGGFGE
jgi:hypothetical protein